MLKVTYFYKEVIYSTIQGKGTPLPSEILNHYQFIPCESCVEQMDFSLIATVTFKKMHVMSGELAWGPCSAVRGLALQSCRCTVVICHTCPHKGKIWSLAWWDWSCAHCPATFLANSPAVAHLPWPPGSLRAGFSLYLCCWAGCG